MASFTLFAQTTLVVTNTLDAGLGSLRQAVIDATGNDTITFDSSLLLNGHAFIQLDSQIVVDKGLYFQGINNGVDTLFVDGAGQCRLFALDIPASAYSRSVRFSQMSFINGVPDSLESISDGGGGAILVSSADSLIISDCTFDNFSTYHTANGGAVKISGMEYTAVLRSHFTGCIAGNNGGGLYSDSTKKTVVHDSRFLQCSTTHFGGGIYVKDGDFNCLGSDFNWVSAEVGGGIYRKLNKGVCRIYNCDFTNDSASRASGMYIDNDTVYIRGCNFVSHVNSSALTGALVSVAGTLRETELVHEIENCYFEDIRNSRGNSTYAGGVLVASGNVRGCSFVNNQATSNLFSCIECHFYNCTFYNNTTTFASQFRLFAYLHPNSSFKIASSMENVTITNSASRDNIIQVSDVTDFRLKNTYLSGNSYGVELVDRYQNLPITNEGYNVFQDSVAWMVGTDLIDSVSSLSPLQMNGGTQPTCMPKANSIAVNAGTPLNFADAQNGPVFGRRDVGAAEYQHVLVDSLIHCGTVTWHGGVYDSAGVYTDTSYNAQSIDSVSILVLADRHDTSIVNHNGTLFSLEDTPGVTYQWLDCANQYSPVMGEVGHTFTPSTNGTYAVVLSSNGCIDTSACYVYDEVSMVELSPSDDKRLIFYPNPASEVIHISNYTTQVSSLSIYDITGRCIVHLPIDGTTVELPVLTEGIYLLRWEGVDGWTQVDRLQVQ